MDKPHRTTIGHSCETEEFCWPVDFPSGTRWFNDLEVAKGLNAQIPGGVRITPPAPRRAYRRPKPQRMSVREVRVQARAPEEKPSLTELSMWLSSVLAVDLT